MARLFKKTKFEETLVLRQGETAAWNIKVMDRISKAGTYILKGEYTIEIEEVDE